MFYLMFYLPAVAEHLCPEGFAKCPASYCIEVSLLCDGQGDCPEGEDETMLGKKTLTNTI